MKTNQSEELPTTPDAMQTLLEGEAPNRFIATEKLPLLFIAVERCQRDLVAFILENLDRDNKQHAKTINEAFARAKLYGFEEIIALFYALKRKHHVVLTQRFSQLNIPIFIQNMLVVNEEGVKGEWCNILYKDEDADSTVKRMAAHANTLMQKAAQLHQSQKNAPHHYTFMINSEFLFFSYEALEKAHFEKLSNEIAQLSASYPDTLHLVLGTFALKLKVKNTDEFRDFNVLIYIQCGKSYRLNFQAKSHRSNLDPCYITIPFNFNNPNKIEKPDLSVIEETEKCYLIRGRKHYLSQQAVHTFHTRLGTLCDFAIDICLDNQYCVAQSQAASDEEKAFSDLFRMSSEQILYALRAKQVAHAVSSHISRVYPENLLGTWYMHADPFYTVRGAYETSSIENKPVFGGRYHVVTTEKRPCNSSSFNRKSIDFYNKIVMVLSNPTMEYNPDLFSTIAANAINHFGLAAAFKFLKKYSKGFALGEEVYAIVNHIFLEKKQLVIDTHLQIQTKNHDSQERKKAYAAPLINKRGEPEAPWLYLASSLNDADLMMECMEQLFKDEKLLEVDRKELLTEWDTEGLTFYHSMIKNDYGYAAHAYISFIAAHDHSVDTLAAKDRQQYTVLHLKVRLQCSADTYFRRDITLEDNLFLMTMENGQGHTALSQSIKEGKYKITSELLFKMLHPYNYNKFGGKISLAQRIKFLKTHGEAYLTFARFVEIALSIPEKILYDEILFRYYLNVILKDEIATADYKITLLNSHLDDTVLEFMMKKNAVSWIEIYLTEINRSTLPNSEKIKLTHVRQNSAFSKAVMVAYRCGMPMPENLLPKLSYFNEKQKQEPAPKRRNIIDADAGAVFSATH